MEYISGISNKCPNETERMRINKRKKVKEQVGPEQDDGGGIVDTNNP